MQTGRQASPRYCTLCAATVQPPADKDVARSVGAVMFYEGTCVGCAQALIAKETPNDVQLTAAADAVLGTLEIVTTQPSYAMQMGG